MNWADADSAVAANRTITFIVCVPCDQHGRSTQVPGLAILARRRGETLLVRQRPEELPQAWYMAVVFGRRPDATVSPHQDCGECCSALGWSTSRNRLPLHAVPYTYPSGCTENPTLPTSGAVALYPWSVSRSVFRPPGHGQRDRRPQADPMR